MQVYERFHTSGADPSRRWVHARTPRQILRRFRSELTGPLKQANEFDLCETPVWVQRVHVRSVLYFTLCGHSKVCLCSNNCECYTCTHTHTRFNSPAGASQPSWWTAHTKWKILKGLTVPRFHTSFCLVGGVSSAALNEAEPETVTLKV